MTHRVRYIVYRNKVCLGIFTFDKLKEWMMQHEAFEAYKQEIYSAHNVGMLADIGGRRDYCLIRKARPEE